MRERAFPVSASRLRLQIRLRLRLRPTIDRALLTIVRGECFEVRKLAYLRSRYLLMFNNLQILSALFAFPENDQSDALTL